MIFRFCYKIMGFCVLSKLLSVALKSPRSNPQHLETNFVPLSHKIFNIYSCRQSCNENKLISMCFLSHILEKKHDCYSVLSLYDAFIFIYTHKLALKKIATKLVVLNFWCCVYIHSNNDWILIRHHLYEAVSGWSLATDRCHWDDKSSQLLSR